MTTMMMYLFAAVVDQLSESEKKSYASSLSQASANDKSSFQVSTNDRSSSEASAGDNSSSQSSANNQSSSLPRWYYLPDEHPCTGCGLTFHTAERLEKHMRWHVENLESPPHEYTCTGCQKWFRSPFGLQKHMREHVENLETPAHECAFCKELFLGKPSQLTQHLISHLEEHASEEAAKDSALNDEGDDLSPNAVDAKFRCTVCGQELDTVADLKSHQLQHARDIAVYCPHCQRPFVNQKIMQQHQRRCPPKTSDSSGSSQPECVFCPTCGKLFRSGHLLAVHRQRVHAGTSGRKTFLDPRSSEKPMCQRTEKRGTHECAFCEKRFVGDSWQLVQHLVCHVNSQAAVEAGHLAEKDQTDGSGAKFMCTICQKELDTVAVLKVHQLQHARNIAIHCPRCQKPFLSPNLMQQHLHSCLWTSDPSSGSHPKDVATCPTCARWFLSVRGLAVHRHSCHADTSGQKSLQDPGNSEKRMRLHARNPETHVCAFCEKQFIGNSRQLVTHLVYHINTREAVDAECLAVEDGTDGSGTKFLCTVCKTELDSLGILKVHQLDHARKMAVPCPLCQELFPSQSHVRRHRPICLRTSDPSSGSHPERFACPACGKSFLSRRSLAAHRQRFHPVIGVRKSFHDPRSSKQRMRRHSGNPKIHECPFCKKRFRGYSRLLLQHLVCCHINSPEADRAERLAAEDDSDGSGAKFPCTVCQIELDTVSILKVHQLQHARDIAVPCPRCRKLFPSASNVRQHLTRCPRTRGGSYLGRVRCPTCAKLFRSRDSLAVHMSGFHGAKRKRPLQTPPPVADPGIISGHSGSSGAARVRSGISDTGHSFGVRSGMGFTGAKRKQTFPNEAPGIIRSPTRSRKPTRARGNISGTGRSSARGFSSSRATRTTAGTRKSRPKRHACPECGGKFKQRSYMVQHLRVVHSAYIPHVCRSCGEGFLLFDNLRRHVLMSHGADGSAVHRCPRCGKVFAKKLSLTLHLRRHEKSTANTNVCGVCGLEFLLTTELAQHMDSAHSAAVEDSDADSVVMLD